MAQATLTPHQKDLDIKRLDELIAAVRNGLQPNVGSGGDDLQRMQVSLNTGNTHDLDDDQRRQILEHLRSARTYLAGAMTEEYSLALRDIKARLTRIHEEGLQRKLRSGVNELIDDVAQALPAKADGWNHAEARTPDGHEIDRTQQTVATSECELSTFFQLHTSGDNSFGVFYPQKYIMAAFASLEVAKGAAAALARSGFTRDEVLAISGSELLKYFARVRTRNGLWGSIMEQFSRLLDTEATFVDKDSVLAQRGAAFLAIYDPDDTEAEKIRDMLLPFQPVSMQRYKGDGILSLV